MRKNMDKSAARQQMLIEQSETSMRQIYKQRSITVEPMQGRGL